MVGRREFELPDRALIVLNEGGTTLALKPRELAPALEVRILDGGYWRLQDARPKTFTMIVVYRGVHCPICKSYLSDLESKLPEFEKRGVEVLIFVLD